MEDPGLYLKVKGYVVQKYKQLSMILVSKTNQKNP